MAALIINANKQKKGCNNMSLKLTGKWAEKYAGQTEIELEDNTFVIPESAIEYNDELKFIALPDSISIIYTGLWKEITAHHAMRLFCPTA